MLGKCVCWITILKKVTTVVINSNIPNLGREEL